MKSQDEISKRQKSSQDNSIADFVFGFSANECSFPNWKFQVTHDSSYADLQQQYEMWTNMNLD